MGTPVILKNQYDTVILGAGISGLWVAHKLNKKSSDFLIVEKSRSVGGRIATRRVDQLIYDHGAQFYKIPEVVDNEFHEIMVKNKVVHTWFKRDGSSFFCSKGGMTQIPKYLSKDLPCLFNQKIIKIHQSPDSSVRSVSGGRNNSRSLLIELESGEHIGTDQIIMTAPLPQSLEILRNSNIFYQEKLDRITYAKAIVALIEIERVNENGESISSGEKSFSAAESKNLEKGFKGSQALKTGLNILLKNCGGYVENIFENIYSMSDQKEKGTCSSEALSVVMTPTWSEKNFELSDEEITQNIIWEMKTEDSRHNLGFKFKNIQIKKWRYSHPIKKNDQKFECLGNNKNIYLIGDAFGGPSIKGALASADAFLNERFRS